QGDVVEDHVALQALGDVAGEPVVDHEQEALPLQPQHLGLGHGVALVVEEQAAARAAHGEAGDVVGQLDVQEGGRVGAGHLERPAGHQGGGERRSAGGGGEGGGAPVRLVCHDRIIPSTGR